jgi:putative SOS response-associated peptidase YedK
MCGRTSLGVSKQALENHYHAEMHGDFHAIYNAAPGEELPIVRNISPDTIDLAKWGFVPQWLAKRRPSGFINTRIETALEKPSFRQATLFQRCLVPSDGFFEWTAGKQPYYFTLKNHDVFSLAGIWDTWQDEGGEQHLTYSIMTTKADERAEKIHDRAPVVLDARQEKRWLDAGLSPEEIEELGRGRSLILTAYPVSKLVNSPKNHGKEVIERS